MQKFYSLSFSTLSTLLVLWSASSWLKTEPSFSELFVATFIVDSASDAGDSNPGDGICDSGCCGCTLRAAIEESNATTAADIITFSGVNAISPSFDLPIITNPLTIDGGSTGGVVINGGGMTSSNFGLNIQSDDVNIYGLAIQNFTNEGILIPSVGNYNNINIGDLNNGCVLIQNGQGLWVGGNVDNLNIVGSFFGTDSGYHTGLGNTDTGIRLQSNGITNATIGGPTPAHGNVIGGNGSIGLEARCNVTIQNNIIGTDDLGTADLGNPINLSLFTLITTGVSLIDNNVIAFSGQSGMSCEHDNVSITNNQIYNNTQRGIDLLGNNCTISNNEIYSNNAVGVAIDGGIQNSLSQNEIYCIIPQGIIQISNGNNNMPSPTIAAASPSLVSGTAQVNSVIEVFIQDETACGGLDCQGRTFVGLATTDGSGNWTMSATSMVTMPANGDQVVATATDASSNSSGFSACFLVSNCPSGSTVSVTNTNDSGAGSLREAIDCAKADSGLDNIEFNIPGPGPHIITLASNLPAITDNSIVLDGRTQAGNSPMQGLIQIDANGFLGIVLSGCADVTIAGLEIYNGNTDNIQLNASATNCLIIDNYLHGIASPRGITINDSGNNFIGQQGAPNYFWELSTAGGINIIGDSDRNIIEYNNFGIDKNGNLVGGGNGISPAISVGDVQCCTEHNETEIRNNTIFEWGIGIQLQDEDAQFTLITNNNFQCNDNAIVTTAGANNDNPFPSIQSASLSAISGTHPLLATQTIEVYIENTNNCTAIVPCQGSIFLGTTTSINGNWTLPSGDYVVSLAEGDIVTATATDPSNNTSIFSNCLTVFNNQFEVLVNPTAPSCQEGSDDYVPNGSFDVIVTNPSGCIGTYDIVISPVANSSPLGNTPPNTVPTTFTAVSAGTYTFNGAGAGDYDVVVTEAGQCISSVNPVNVTVTVPDGSAPDIPTLSSLGPFCISDPIFDLPVIQDGFTGSWSGPGIQCCDEFTPSVAGVGTWTWTFDPDQGQCAAIATINVTVEQFITPTFSFPTTYLENDQVVALPTTSDNNVSGSWSGSGIACCNEFDPSLSGVGSWTIVFTPDQGECAEIVNIDIEVLQLDEPFTLSFTATTPSCQEGTTGYVPNATIDIVVNDPTTCGGAVYDIVLTPVPNSSPSGTTPNNVTPAGFFAVPAGTYSFAAAGSGDYDVVVTEVGGPCNPPVNPETIVANVLNGPAPSNINPTPVGPLCEGDPIVNLNPVQGSFTGSWSGPGISCCNEFDPIAVGPGSWELTFTPDQGQCVNDAVLTIVVLTQPVGTPITLTACKDEFGQGLFNLVDAEPMIDPLGNPIAWFEDLALTIPITDPLAYSSISTSVFAVLSNGVCNSSPVEIILTTLLPPVVVPATLTECEESNGQAIFNLNTLNSTVNGGTGNAVRAWRALAKAAWALIWSAASCAARALRLRPWPSR